jgi:hypothetical protein
MFLTDPPASLYYVFAAVLIVTGLVAVQKQDRRALAAFGAAFLLVAVFFLIDKLNESPREEAERRVHFMAAAATVQNPDAFCEHLAPEVELHTTGGPPVKKGREDLRAGGFWGQLRFMGANVRVWDFGRTDVKEIDENEIEIGFMARGADSSGKMFPLYGRATFRRQQDGQFKLTVFKSFNAVSRKEPQTIPNFP